MAASGSYSLTIGVVDRSSAAIDAINKRLQKMQDAAKTARAPFDALGKSMAKFADLSGINAVTGGIKKIGEAAVGVVDKLASVGTALTGIGLGLSVAGVVSFANAWGRLSTQLLNNAHALSMTTGQLYAWRGAAELAGVSGDDLQQGMQNLGQAMQDAVIGKSPDVVRLLNTWGISFQKTRYEAKSAADVFGEVADRLRSYDDQPVIQREAARMLGIENLLPLIRLGSAAIENYKQKVVSYGVVNEKAAIEGNRFRAATEGLKLAFVGVGNSIMERVGPSMTKLVDWFSDLIARNRDLIAQKIGVYFDRFSNWVKTVDWDKLLANLTRITDEVIKFASNLDIKKIGEAVLAYYALVWSVRMVAAITQVTNAFKALNVAATVNPAALLAITTVAAAIATKRNSDEAATAQDVATKQGYTEIVSTDPNSGNPTFYRNPKTKDVKSWMFFDPKYNPALQQTDDKAAPAAPGIAAPAPATTPAGVADPVTPVVPGITSGSTGITDPLTAKNTMTRVLQSEFGLDAQHVGSILGTIKRESGFDPTEVGDNGSARGMMQWHPDRRDNIKAGTGIDVASDTDVADQTRAIMWELKNKYPGVYQEWLSAKSAKQAAEILTKEFVKPADMAGESEKRGDLADSYAAQLGAPITPASGQPSSDAVKGDVSVRVHVTGQTDGVRVTAASSGNAFSQPPRINTAMPGFAAP